MQEYILWLPSWYPTAVAPFDGDFIQRHAKAVSIYKKIIVVFVKKDAGGVVTGRNTIMENDNGNLKEIICYYRPITTGIGFLDKIISFVSYHYFFRKTVSTIIKKNGAPSLIHTHVIQKTAWLSLRLKKKLKLPLVVTEHWTGFLPETKKELEKINPLLKWRWKKLLNNADEITVVSDVLRKSMQEYFSIKQYKVIPNVVDTSIFYPKEKDNKPSTVFIHISLGGNQKNIPDMLKAFGMLKANNIDFQLHLFVPDKNRFDELIVNNKLGDDIIFHEEVPQQELAAYMQESDALVLYSNYETFGCVVIEANTAGIPAILSDLEVFREFSVEKQTCLFAEKNNPEKLAETLMNFINNKNQFDSKDIAERTKTLFSFETIGKQFSSIYVNLLGKKQKKEKAYW